MKIALYIEDGLEQIVLTPETETEKGIIGKMHDGTGAGEGRKFFALGRVVPGSL